MRAKGLRGLALRGSGVRGFEVRGWRGGLAIADEGENHGAFTGFEALQFRTFWRGVVELVMHSWVLCSAHRLVTLKVEKCMQALGLHCVLGSGSVLALTDHPTATLIPRPNTPSIPCANLRTPQM